MTLHRVLAGDLMARRSGSVDPAKFPDEIFELHSIPAFDVGRPEIIRGSKIGSTKQIVQPDDVMISKIVPHIRRASVVGPATGMRQIASGEWIVFRSERIHPPYLRHVLTSDEFNASFMRTVSGVGGSLLRARPAEVAKIEIPLPPFPEQRRIAAILDKADALRAKRREAIAKLDQLLQSVFLNMFGDPVTNPKGYPVTNLGDVALQVTDGAHHTPERQVSGIPLLSARNVQMGYLDFENVDYVGTEEFERLRKRCEPQLGDILISCSGSIGRVASVQVDRPFTLVRSAALLKLNRELVDSTFIEHLLRTEHLQRQMQQSARAVAQANLFQGPIKALRVMVPPFEQQKDFKAVVAAFTRQRQRIYASSKSIEQLASALQQRVFSSSDVAWVPRTTSQ